MSDMTWNPDFGFDGTTLVYGYGAEVSDTASNKLCWSIMIPAYNPGPALVDAVASAQAATKNRTDVEIVVVDDASTTPVELQQSDGAVQLVNHVENRGAVANFNRSISLARGEFIHLLHADDVVHRGFYESMERGFREHGAALGSCRVERIDAKGRRIGLNRSEADGAGIWVDALRVLAVSNRLPAPGIAVRRSVYERLGVFDVSLNHAADWDMWVRIAAVAPIYYEPEVLAAYRIHEGQHTTSVAASGDNIQQAIEVIDRLSDRVSDPAIANSLQIKALAYSGAYAARAAAQAARNGQPKIAAKQSSMAVRCFMRGARKAALGH